MPLSKAKNKERMQLQRVVQPKVRAVQPNKFLAGHLRYCPDYNPVQPRDHFDNCPYINPMLRSKDYSVIPKYPLGYMCPDGRMRLPDMTVVKPDEVEKFIVGMK